MTVGARSFAFLVNPQAGGGSAPRVVIGLARSLREAGAEVAVTYTTSPEETPVLVTSAVERGDVVVAVGGDGMVSSVAGAVATADGVLAVIPAGRGNDFARMLEVPHDVPAQAQLLLASQERKVDLLSVQPGRSRAVRHTKSQVSAHEVADNGIPVVVAGSVYAGVDARAAEIVDRSHWLPGKLQYPVAAVRALAGYRPLDCVLEVDGVRSEHRAATVVIANSRYYGKGMAIAPAAVVDDGLLDVIVIEAAGRLDLIRSLPRLYDGTHVDLDEVTVLTGRSVRLSGVHQGGADVPVGADGESLGSLPTDAAHPLQIDLLPAALRMLG